jgi:UDP-N-acetylmuramoylalanine--D-glutamate ligase
MNEYVEAKENIFLYQQPGDILVTNLDNELTVQSARKAPAQVRYFSRRDAAYASCTTGADISLCGQTVMDASDIKIPGTHNIENYLAAFAATADYVDADVMQKVAMTFGGVEHRLELVRELDGVKYYNDSIASSPSRTIAGLRAYNQKVILIAGGYDKHIPYDVLGPVAVEKVKALHLCGATEEKIYQAVVNAPGYSSEDMPITFHKDYEEMMAAIRKEAVPGDVVLFSPASASFDRFPNFMKRGEYFKQLVNELK